MDSASWMEKAISLALENVRQGRGGPFAALVVKDGRLVGSGTNLVTATNDPTAHAELVAIREACRALGSFQLTGCEIYTTCEPCPMCMGAIYWARPARLYYAGTRGDAARIGFDDAYIYEQLRLPAGERAIPMAQVLREQALAAFAEWERKQDRVMY
jgi:tRNA(Arg) A34 adenosine deaminase TadA